jgi:glutamate dehydrogenase/leucine dehydrogenase
VGTIYEGADSPSIRSGLFSTVLDDDPAAYHFTGYGVAIALTKALESIKHPLQGASIAIEGFGQVGVGTARYLHQWGARVVAITTLRGGLYDPEGLDIEQLLKLRREHGDACVLNYEGNAEPLEPQDLYFLSVDVVVPGARPYVIDGYNASRVRAKVVCPAANIAVTEEAEDALHAQGIICLPDFLTNSGAALASWVDILEGTPDKAKEVVGRSIGSVTADVLEEATHFAHSPSKVARQRVRKKIISSERQRLTFDETRAIIKELLGV